MIQEENNNNSTDLDYEKKNIPDLTELTHTLRVDKVPSLWHLVKILNTLTNLNTRIDSNMNRNKYKNMNTYKIMNEYTNINLYTK